MARISATLGLPGFRVSTGSTEPRTFLACVAETVGVPSDQHATKAALARAIVEAGGSSWDFDFESTGGTITLKGLHAVERAVRVLMGT